MKYFRLFLLLMLPIGAFAQEMTPEEQQKKIMETIQQEVEKLEATLDLEYWQVFYADSVMTANYLGMYGELMDLSRKKVSNSTLYEDIRDKWSEATYQAFRKFLSPEQWDQYLKQGAAREKRARDKRTEKRKDKI